VIALKVYEFAGNEPMVFTTLGIELNPGDKIQSDIELNNSYLKEVKLEEEQVESENKT
jgi:hypothetical protein